MPRHPAAFALLALCLVAALAPHAAVALTFPDAVQSLIPKLAGPNPPGEDLFKEDFSTGKLDAWKPDQGWSLVDRPDGPGKCAQVIASEKVNENLILKQHIKIVPGHPVVVAYKTRFVSGGDPLYLRVDFFDETGVNGIVLHLAHGQGAVNLEPLARCGLPGCLLAVFGPERLGSLDRAMDGIRG